MTLADDVLAMLPSETVTLKRSDGSGSNIDGEWNPGVRGSATFTASVQPATGKEMLTLPEAQRLKEGLSIFTTTELRTVDQENGVETDVIEYNGVEFEIVKVEHYPVGDLAHYEALAVRLED